MRRRLDAELVRRGLAPTRSAARGLVRAKRVLVSGSLATKPARMVDPGDPLALVGEGPRFVSRGGEKLDGALEGFRLDVSGLRVLDAGASTGGFTDCLLRRGAAQVVALDVGHGQLDQRIRTDERVEVLERTNLRHVDPAGLGGFDAVVADLSFISLTIVLGILFELVRDDGWLVLLVKPQFECDRAAVSRGRGVIRDPEAWTAALERVLGAALESGAAIMGVMVSPLRGAEGNVEFLVHMAAPGAQRTRPDARERSGSGATGGFPADVAALVRAAVLSASAMVTSCEPRAATPGGGVGS